MRRSGIIAAIIAACNLVFVFPGLVLHMITMKLFLSKLKYARLPRWEAIAHDNGFPILRYCLAVVFERSGYSGYIAHRGGGESAEVVGGEGFFDVGLGWASPSSS